MFFAMTLLLACAPSRHDSDGDRITDLEETSVGTDARRRDTDLDGLDDAAELLWVGTDPLLPDTDGDGGMDGWEVELGLDPLDWESGPYELGWPMAKWADKEGLVDGVPPLQATVGQPVARVRLYDLANDAFDLYDYSATGVPTLIGALHLRGEPADMPLLRWTAGSMNLEGDEGPERWVRDLAEEGRLNLVLVAVAPPWGQLGVDVPERADLLEMCFYDTPRFGCFADSTLALYHYLGPPEDVESAWVLLDAGMVVRGRVDVDSAAAPDAFEDLEQTLAAMLSVTPPG
jgi:hypothetical protein